MKGTPGEALESSHPDGYVELPTAFRNAWIPYAAQVSTGL